MLQNEKGVLERIADSLERIASNLDILTGRTSDIQPSNRELLKEIIYKEHAASCLAPVSPRNHHLPVYEEYDGVEVIRDFFSQYGIIVQDYDKTDYSDYDTIAKFIGDRYDYVVKFYNELRQSISNKCEKRTLDLFFASAESLTDTVNLGKKLDEYQFFDKFDYYKAPIKRIDFKHTNDGEKINFINGGWLETYISLKLSETLDSIKEKSGIDFQYTILKNVKLKMNGGKGAEFDIFCEVNQEMFWIEAKSHNLDETTLKKCFTKYDDYSRILGLGENRAFVVHTNPQNSYINWGAYDYPHLKILPHKDFQKTIGDMVRKELQIS